MGTARQTERSSGKEAERSPQYRERGGGAGEGADQPKSSIQFSISSPSEVSKLDRKTRFRKERTSAESSSSMEGNSQEREEKDESIF